MYYKGASVAILVYDVTRTTSFERLKKWVSELNDKGPEVRRSSSCGPVAAAVNHGLLYDCRAGHTAGGCRQ